MLNLGNSSTFRISLTFSGTIGFKEACSQWERLVLPQDLLGTIGFKEARPHKNDFSLHWERLLLSQALLGTIGFKEAGYHEPRERLV